MTTRVISIWQFDPKLVRLALSSWAYGCVGDDLIQYCNTVIIFRDKYHDFCLVLVDDISLDCITKLELLLFLACMWSLISTSTAVYHIKLSMNTCLHKIGHLNKVIIYQPKMPCTRFSHSIRTWLDMSTFNGGCMQWQK